MKFIVALWILFAAMPALGRERAPLYPPPYAGTAGVDEPDAPAPSAAPAWRATQVNRCADTNGRVKLQDVPCSPVAAEPALAASAAAGIVELSTLEPRSPVDATRAAIREPEGNSLVGVLLAVAWKLGLFLLVGYAVFRLLRAWRDSYRFAQPTGEMTGPGGRRVR